MDQCRETIGKENKAFRCNFSADRRWLKKILSGEWTVQIQVAVPGADFGK
jgi:hypothetical protein